MRETNEALVTMFGWGLIKRKDGLKAKVIRGKYSCRGDLRSRTQYVTFNIKN